MWFMQPQSRNFKSTLELPKEIFASSTNQIMLAGSLPVILENLSTRNALFRSRPISKISFRLDSEPDTQRMPSNSPSAQFIEVLPLQAPEIRVKIDAE